MKIHNNITAQNFISRLVYWNIIFYSALMTSSLGFWILQEVVVFIKQPILLSIFTLVIFFLVGGALVLAIINVIAYVLLRPKLQYKIYMAIWITISFATSLFFALILMQAVLTQASV